MASIPSPLESVKAPHMDDWWKGMTPGQSPTKPVSANPIQKMMPKLKGL